MVRTTRPMSWRTERSRSGVPSVPRKYFWTTMFVASWDQDFGTSTSFCSKTTSPRSLVISALRSSHSTVSNGWVPGCVWRRLNESPLGAAAGAASGAGFGTLWRGGDAPAAGAGVSAPFAPGVVGLSLDSRKGGLLCVVGDRRGGGAALPREALGSLCPPRGSVKQKAQN